MLSRGHKLFKLFASSFVRPRNFSRLSKEFTENEKITLITLFKNRFEPVKYDHRIAVRTIGSEHFKFVPDENNRVANDIISVFRARVDFRGKNLSNDTVSPMSKRMNAVVGLTSQPGSGKSTQLAHLPESPGFGKYHISRQTLSNKDLVVSKAQPLVCLISFNSQMSFLKNETPALGLRIIFSALCATNAHFTENWDDFRSQYKHLDYLSGVDAVKFLRNSVFGSDRLILLCVDELQKIEEADCENGKLFVKEIMSNLGALLDTDGRTDVVVSSLTPEYVEKLVSGSNRKIAYVAIPPLNNGELDEQFAPYGDMLMDQLKQDLSLALSPFLERILRSMHLLASGHPRTIEELTIAIERREVLQELEPLFLHTDNPNAYGLLKTLTRLAPFQYFYAVPSSDQQREMVLSMRKMDVTKDTEMRMMLERNQCYIYKQVGQRMCILTVSLAAFFDMVQNIGGDVQRRKAVGPLSRAVHALFGQLQQLPDTQFADIWERCIALDQVSRVNLLRSDGESVVSAMALCGLNKKLQRGRFGFELLLSRDKDLKAKVAVEERDMKWAPDTLFVSPSSTVGFDLMVCLRDARGKQAFLYKEIKVQPPHARGESIADLFARKLLFTLRYHVERCGLQSLDVKKQLAALDTVLFVLSVYGAEWHKDHTAVLQCLMNREKSGGGKPVDGVELAKCFVQERWHQVAFQGTQEIKESTLPVVLPVAQVVQEAGSSA